MCSEQKKNLRFVREVKKFPQVYNYNLAEYSNRARTEKAWETIAETLQSTPAECKQKWKNLRTVYIRQLKPQNQGKKAYYLMDAMSYLIPFLKNKLVSTETDNSSDYPVIKEEREEYEEEGEGVGVGEDHSQDMSCESDGTSATALAHHDVTAPGSDAGGALAVHSNKRKRPQRQRQRQRDTDHVMRPAASNSNVDDGREESMKMFLLSLLPDLMHMSDDELRSFKRSSLEAIDEIFSNRTWWQHNANANQTPTV